MSETAMSRSEVLPDLHKMRPVFICGVGRSGTTLVQALVGSHPNIAIARGDLDWWTRLYPRYRPVRADRAWQRFVDELLTMRQTRALGLDAGHLRQTAGEVEPDYACLFAAILSEYAAKLGKRRWGDKTPHLERHADDILARFPQARFVHLVRDPRDVYTSTRAADFWWPVVRWVVTNPAWVMLNWRESVSLAERHRARYPDHYLVVRYEDFVADPAGTLQRICSFLGETYREEMFEMADFAGFQERGGNSSYEILQGISRSPVGRFRHVLTPAQTWLCERLAGPLLQTQGYQPTGIALTLREWPKLALMEILDAALHVALWWGLRWLRRLFPRFAERRPREGPMAGKNPAD